MQPVKQLTGISAQQCTVSILRQVVALAQTHSVCKFALLIGKSTAQRVPQQDDASTFGDVHIALSSHIWLTL